MTLQERISTILGDESLKDNTSKADQIISGLYEYMVSKDQYAKKTNEISDLTTKLNQANESIANLNKKIEEATLSQDELKEKAIKDALEEAEKTKREYNLKSNRLEAIRILEQANLKEEDYKDFIDDIVKEDIEKTKSLTTSIVSTLSRTKENAIEETKKQIQGDNPTPPAGDGNADVMTKEKLAKMTYTEEVAFMQKNPELYQKLISE